MLTQPGIILPRSADITRVHGAQPNYLQMQGCNSCRLERPGAGMKAYLGPCMPVLAYIPDFGLAAHRIVVVKLVMTRDQLQDLD